MNKSTFILLMLDGRGGNKELDRVEASDIDAALMHFKMDKAYVPQGNGHALCVGESFAI